MEQAKDEFVSTVSHELRTPLTSIRGALALAAASVTVDVPEKVRHLLDVANRNSERLTRLVDDLLDVQRIAAGRMIYHLADVSLSPLIEDAVEANRPFGFKSGVEIVLKAKIPGIRVRADAERLMQVMNNLLSNAIKYSKTGQAVEVSIERRSPWVRITVEDHGEGIPSDFHSKMFKPFSQLDSSDSRPQGRFGAGAEHRRCDRQLSPGPYLVRERDGSGHAILYRLEGIGRRGKGRRNPRTAGSRRLGPVRVQPRAFVIEQPALARDAATIAVKDPFDPISR